MEYSGKFLEFSLYSYPAKGLLLGGRIVSLARVLDKKFINAPKFALRHTQDLAAERKAKASTEHPLRKEILDLTAAVRTLAEVQA